MPQEIRITYESLFDILRKEKGREDLQPLDGTFFADVINYLNQKQEVLQQKASGGGGDELNTTLIQMNNIKKMIKELYERRERKIIGMAVHRARLTSDMIIDTTSLLPEEKQLYSNIVKVLQTQRKDVLDKVVSQKAPTITPPTPQPKIINTPTPPEEKPAPKPSPDNTNIRFLKAVPKFMGKNMQVFGPFESGDTAELPTPFANLLIQKGRAEPIN